MKIAVVGMWHLGTVTAACLASGGHQVIGIDTDADLIGPLKHGQLPVYEPGLGALTLAQVDAHRLQFSTDFAAVRNVEIVWIAYDTPVDDDDRADVAFVIRQIEKIFPHLRDGATVLISSQLPVGSTARVERVYRESKFPARVSFAYSPENLRLGKAIEVFTQPDRVVVGVRTDADRARLAPVWTPFTDRLEWMSVESAEMTKHALNAFLATSVAFVNEIATICEQVGADAIDVERGLKSDVRIGRKSYLHPGGAFAGGTLARDIEFLRAAGAERGLGTFLLGGVRASNDAHRGWLRRRLPEIAGPLAGKTLAVLGLAYKPGTNTLRRSAAIEDCRWLHAQGVRVNAFDPAISELPDELADILHVKTSVHEAISGADALLIATACPEFLLIHAEDVVHTMRMPLVIDPARHLESSLGHDLRIRYFAVGVPLTLRAS